MRDLQKTTDFIEQKLKEKEFITEYNTYMNGIHLMDTEALRKVLTDYPDFAVVTCMHHPMNWLAQRILYVYRRYRQPGIISF